MSILFFYSDIFRLIERFRIWVDKRSIRRGLIIVLIACAFTNKNFVLITKDLFEGVSAKYDLESYQRYDAIKSCKSDTCFVAAHQNWPYFAQSSQKETSDVNYFQHMNVFFKKTILFT